MKSGPLLLLLASFLFISPPVSADADSATGTSPNTSPTMGRGRHGGGKQINPSPGGKNPGTIRGVCFIGEGPMNPFPGPCVNLLLVLNDADGNEVVKTRTTPQGQFDFTAEQGKAYRLASGSKFYEVVAPKDPVHGGDKVNLQLQQK